MSLIVDFTCEYIVTCLQLYTQIKSIMNIVLLKIKEQYLINIKKRSNYEVHYESKVALG